MTEQAAPRSEAVPTIPGRGRRPRNRRDLILRAARQHLVDAGYAHTGMSDIAAAVAVGPSALYRHFRTKHDLLAAVLEQNLAEVEEAVVTAGEAPAGKRLEMLGAVAVEHRGFAILWAREIQHLDAATRTRVEQRIAAVLVAVRKTLRGIEGTARASALDAWVAMAAIASTSYYRTPLSERTPFEVAQLVTDLIERRPVALRDAIDPASNPFTDGSRREQLLAIAVDLFSRHGYAEVGIDDIGAAASLAGNAIYRNFDTKADVLLEAMLRGAQWLRSDLDRAFADHTDPGEVLRSMVRGYLALTTGQPGLTSILVSETGHLPDEARLRIRQEQRDYEGAWLTLLRQVHPGLDHDTARIRIHTVFTLANLTPRHPVLGLGAVSTPVLVARLESAAFAALRLA